MKQLLLTMFLAAGLVAPMTVAQVFASPPLDPEVHPPIHVKPSSTVAPAGYSPKQILNAYGFSQLGCEGTLSCGAGQTIAIIDAYDDPTAANDLNTFSSQFGLPQCNVNDPCFTKNYPSGVPRADSGWALEESLDIEWAHAIAPAATIHLVEAKSNSLSNLLAAVDYAVNHLGAKVVSMSWGSAEFSSEASYDYHFNKPGIVFFASSGDSGSINYPAASPFVIGVGGTSLPLDANGNLVGSETAWSSSGGGISAYEQEQSYQSSFNGTGIATGGKRAVPDVSYDADPNTGVSVYDSTVYQGQKGWFIVGGTSAGSPQWAALAAITYSSSMTAPSISGIYNAAAYNSTSMTNPYATDYRDITQGTNTSGYHTGTGYDEVTGLGSPLANSLIPKL
jgi:subtilase family serine protease